VIKAVDQPCVHTPADDRRKATPVTTPLQEAGDLLDDVEVAERLGTTRLALKALRLRGGGPPAVRVCGRRPWKYRRGDLEKWLAQRPTSESRDHAR
jgi:hypothetical protein